MLFCVTRARRHSRVLARLSVRAFTLLIATDLLAEQARIFTAEIKYVCVAADVSANFHMCMQNSLVQGLGSGVFLSCTVFALGPQPNVRDLCIVYVCVCACVRACLQVAISHKQVDNYKRQLLDCCMFFLFSS